MDLEQVGVSEPRVLRAGDHDWGSPRTTIVPGELDRQFLAMVADGNFRPLTVSARKGKAYLPFGKVAVSDQNQPAAREPFEETGGAAGVDRRGSRVPSGNPLVVGERFPEELPIGAQQHPQSAILELLDGRLRDASVVADSAQIDHVASPPRSAIVRRGVGHHRVPSGGKLSRRGDWTCHVIDPVFWALNLGTPSSVQAQAKDYDPKAHADTFPWGDVITYEFPAKGKRGPITLIWHSGTTSPKRTCPAFFPWRK